MDGYACLPLCVKIPININDFFLFQDPNVNLSIDKYTRLPELSSVPWTERDVLNVLCEGRAKDVAANLPIDVVHRLSYLLQVTTLTYAERGNGEDGRIK